MYMKYSQLNDWFKANRLSLNINKTNFIYFKKSKNDQNTNLNFDGIVLHKSDHVKFLGIYIDEKLNWKYQVNYIHSQVCSGLYALRRLKLLLPKFLLKTIYFSLIESHLTYGLSVWGGAYASYLKPLYVLQKKSIRVICNKPYNYPTADLFKELKILNLSKLYKLNLGKLMFRYIIKEVPCCLNNLFIMNYDIHKYSTRQNRSAHFPVCRCTPYRQSFLFNAPKLWIQLDNNLTNCRSLSQFKCRFKKFLINNDVEL